MLAILLVLALVLVSFATEAQHAAKLWRLGYLSAGFQRPDLEKAFHGGLREFGYVERQNLIVEYRYAEGELNKLSQLAGELVKLRPDVVVALGSAEVAVLQRARTTIPIVMVLVPDPVALGLVKTLARPGGNVTGLTSTPGIEIPPEAP